DLLPVPDSDVAGPPPPNSMLSNRIDVPPRLKRWTSSFGKVQGRALRIIFPRAQSIVGSERDGNGSAFVPITADGGEFPYFWFIDGKELTDNDAKIRWHPEFSGPVSVTVMDSSGKTSTIEFTIQ